MNIVDCLEMSLFLKEKKEKSLEPESHTQTSDICIHLLILIRI